LVDEPVVGAAADVPTAELPPDELLCANAPVKVKAITVAKASITGRPPGSAGEAAKV
jgi:hypothetical protein